MKRVFWAILLISGTALAQAGRYDSNAWTAATNVPIGTQAPIFTIPYASITICTDSSCDTPVAIYLDRAESQPIVQPFQADAFGKFGFWAAPGTYWYEACSPAGDCDTGWLTVGGSGGGGTGCVGPLAAGDVLFSTTSGGCNGVDKFTSESHGYVNINGGGNLEIDANTSVRNNFSFEDGAHYTLNSTGAAGELGGIDLEIFDDDYTYIVPAPGGGPIPYFANLHVDQLNRGGVGMDLNMDCGATNCSGFIGAEVDMNPLNVTTAYGFEAHMANAGSTTASQIYGFLTTPAVGGPVSANYCDFVGGRGLGFAVKIGCGPNSTSTFYGPVDTPSLTTSTLYSAGTPLPTCNSGSKGMQAIVSDATSPTYMSAYASGGTITAAVLCSFNGTTYSWLTH